MNMRKKFQTKMEKMLIAVLTVSRILLDNKKIREKACKIALKSIDEKEEGTRHYGYISKLVVALMKYVEEDPLVDEVTRKALTCKKPGVALGPLSFIRENRSLGDRYIRELIAVLENPPGSKEMFAAIVVVFELSLLDNPETKRPKILKNAQTRKKICKIALAKINEINKKKTSAGDLVRFMVAPLVEDVGKDPLVDEVIRKALTCNNVDVAKMTLRAIETAKIGKRYVKEIIALLEKLPTDQIDCAITALEIECSAAEIFTTSEALKNDVIRGKVCEIVSKLIDEEKREDYCEYGVGKVLAAALVPYAWDPAVDRLIRASITCDKPEITKRMLKAIEKAEMSRKYMKEIITVLENPIRVDLGEKAAELVVASGVLGNKEVRKNVCEVLLKRINEKREEEHSYWGVRKLLAALVPYANEDEEVKQLINKAASCDKPVIRKEVQQAIETGERGTLAGHTIKKNGKKFKKRREKSCFLEE